MKLSEAWTWFILAFISGLCGGVLGYVWFHNRIGW